MKKNRLELTWIGKDKRPNLEPRVLIEDPEKSYHSDKKVTDDDLFDNRLIFGDNLLALKALEQDYTGKVKCIYIDPPYNTGSAFEHYDDNLEHSTWLSLMMPRLELLRKLLREDGSIWISIDADESHYLKVLCDEVFGRNNFIDEVIWQRAYSPINLKKTLSRIHDTILVYSKDVNKVVLGKLVRSMAADARYKNPDNDPRGPWKSSDFSVGPAIQDKLYPIVTPSGRTVYPPEGRCWVYSYARYLEMREDNRVWFGPNGNNVPSLKRFLTDVKQGITPVTLWLRDDVGDNQEAKKEIKSLFTDDVFTTPKPERLINRIIQIGSEAGDIVLDSFAGSGTTGAVAHKMGRKWIMVELGEHCHTHIIPRMQKVIDGTDQGGISKAVNWKGGGGFRYYRLAPSLLEKDKWGNWVINKEYNKELLAEAVCKLEGFTYAPSDTLFWQHGHSTETDFIYVTTQSLNEAQLRFISEEVGEDRSLLILCLSYHAETRQFGNLTVKKIPKHVLDRCEYGKDDYSLNIQNLPQAEKDEIQSDLFNGEI